MTIQDFAAQVLRELEAAGIPYMVVGSVASSFHGDPRSTRDLDIVIDPEPKHLDRFVQRLTAAGLYADSEVGREALNARTQFNVVDPESGWKVDLIVRKDRPFSREEFSRRTEADLPFGRMSVATAEDTILAKLEWARSGESERQLRDAAGIVAVSGPDLDLEYLDRWAAELGVHHDWERIRPKR
jgi:hypothetical protein